MWEGEAWLTFQCKGCPLISLHRAGSSYLPSSPSSPQAKLELLRSSSVQVKATCRKEAEVCLCECVRTPEAPPVCQAMSSAPCRVGDAITCFHTQEN